MRIEGIHTCSECKNDFEWITPIAQPMSSAIYDVETIDKPRAGIVQKTDEAYSLMIYCPECGIQNWFEFSRLSSEENKVLSVLSREPKKIHQIAIKTNLPESDVIKAIHTLIQKGLVDNSTDYINVTSNHIPTYFLKK